MTSVGRTWELWAVKRADREHAGEFRFFYVGTRDWVSVAWESASAWVVLHGSSAPVVPVLVEEILGDLFAPEVTNYGWEDLARPRPGDEDDPRIPCMVQVRAGNDPNDPRRALMLLNMCFPYGLDAEVEHGAGRVLALRITERAG